MLQGSKSARAVLIAAVLIINAVVVFLLFYTLNDAKHQKERETRTTIENLALLLDHSVTESTERIDLALRGIGDDLTRELRLRGHLDRNDVDTLLATRQHWLSEIAKFRVTDASGEARYGAGLMRGYPINYSDRDFFVSHRDHPYKGLMVSNPILGQHSKQWLIIFSRRYNFPDGRFAGVVIAAVRVSYFAHLLSGLDLGPHGVALLRDSNTALIVRIPPEAVASQQLGAKTYSKELADIIASGVPAKTYHSKRTADGVERMNTYRRLSAVPFHLVAGEGTEDYLADWRGTRTRDVIIAAMFMMATSFLAWLLWRSFSLTEKSGERCRLLLRHASDGIHILNAKGNLLEASDSFCRMLGYDRNEMIGMNVREWDAMIPVDRIGEEIAKAAKKREIVTLETRHMRKDGSQLDVEITSYPVNLDGHTVLYVSARDITERKQAEKERRIAAVAFESHQGMLVTDADSTIIRVNHTFTEVTGYEAAEVIGKTPSLLKSGRHDDDFYAGMWRMIQQQGYWEGEIWNRRKNGEIYPEWLTISAVRDTVGKTTHYVASFWDITRRIENEKEVRNLAFYDPLTGLANRRLLTDRLDHAFAKSARNGNYGALLFIDLDRFKQLNDALGHAQGDQLLELVADRLTVSVREEDTVARLGGDEFVVLLEDLNVDQGTAKDMALAIAEKLLAALDVPYHLHAAGSKGWHCSASIGLSLFHGHDETAEDALARADQAMYAAKGAGRNRLYLADG